jgi:hypothetical protein
MLLPTQELWPQGSSFRMTKTRIASHLPCCPKSLPRTTIRTVGMVASYPKKRYPIRKYSRPNTWETLIVIHLFCYQLYTTERFIYKSKKKKKKKKKKGYSRSHDIYHLWRSLQSSPTSPCLFLLLCLWDPLRIFDLFDPSPPQTHCEIDFSTNLRTDSLNVPLFGATALSVCLSLHSLCLSIPSCFRSFANLWPVWTQAHPRPTVRLIFNQPPYGLS